MADLRYALHALRGMLQPPGPTRGGVVRLVGGIAEVATDQGLQRVQAAGTLRAGQRVRISGGAAYPMAAAAARYAL